MKENEHDELWELLGKAREPKCPPFFASKVLRAIREEAQEPKVTFWQWLRRSWLLPTVSTATAAIAVFFALQEPSPRVNSDFPVADVKIPHTEPVQLVKAEPLSGLVDAMSAMADEDDMSTSLPDLLATEDHSVWLQADPSSLF